MTTRYPERSHMSQRTSAVVPISPQPLSTVFTPTCNGAHAPHRVHESRRAQTLTDFVRLIADDGSSDGTAALVEQWQREEQHLARRMVGARPIAWPRREA